MKKRLLCILTVISMLVGLFPTIALATNTSTMYLDDTGVEQYTGDTATTAITDQTTWSSGWYEVTGQVTISSRITVTGDVHLILADGATLTASAGITVNEGNSLTIY
ncbi:MAG: hypothetical protein R3Y09_07570, partial [Clostridia bacterium]